MRRTICSTVVTFGLKVVLPLIWLGFLASVLYMGIRYGTMGENTALLALFWTFCAVIIYKFGVKLKQVSIDEQYLYISNYLRRTKVPLRQIQDVWEQKLINWHRIGVRFQGPTRFGEEIYFVPIPDYSFGEHPIVEELKGLARSAKKGD